jgi:glycosyltransferase involved in cell wall biosynthesis
MLSNPLVSIIIPTHNSSEYLEVALESLTNQTYNHIEIIVIDYQSQDETTAIAKSYTPKVIQSTNPLTPDRYNEAVNQATGQYLYLMEPTWILEPTVIAESILKINNEHQAIIIHTSPDDRHGLVPSIRKLEIDTYKYCTDNSVARFLPARLYRAIGGLRSIQSGWDYDLQTRLTDNNVQSIYIDAEAMDLSQPTRWRQLITHFYTLGYNLRQYMQTPNSLNKLSPIRANYLKYWIRFARQPLLSIGFGFYMIIKYMAGGLGLVHSLISNFNKTLFPVPVIARRRQIPVSNNKHNFYE